MISEEDLPRFVAVASSSAMSTLATLFFRLSCAVVYVCTGEKADEASLVASSNVKGIHHATYKRNVVNAF